MLTGNLVVRIRMKNQITEITQFVISEKETAHFRGLHSLTAYFKQSEHFS